MTDRRVSADLFPFLARFAQETRLPLTIISAQMVETASGKPSRLAEVTTMTVSHTGATSRSNYLFDATLVATTTAPARRVSGLGAVNVVPVERFYDLLTKVLLSTLVVGFGCAKSDIPLLTSLMESISVPVLRPKSLLDLQSVWWEAQKAEAGDLSAAAASYGIPLKSAPFSEEVVIAVARLMEAMLWRLGCDSVAKGISVNEFPYAPAVATTHTEAKAPKSRKEREISRGREIRQKVLEHLSSLNPNDKATANGISEALGISQAASSIALGELLVQRKIDYQRFADPAAQALLDPLLPQALEKLGNQKLKPLKEALEELCGTEVDYTQLRIALIKRDL